MKNILQTSRRYYRVLITFLGLAALLVGTVLFPATNANLWVAFLILFVVAFLVNFPLDLLHSEIMLLQIVTLGGGLLYGTITVAWSAALGIFIGYLIRQFCSGAQRRPWVLPSSWWLDTGFAIGLNILPLMVALPALGWVEGFRVDPQAIHQVWTEALLPTLVFSVSHGLLFLLDFYLLRLEAYEMLNQDIMWLIIIELLPLPLIMLAIEAYPAVGDKTMIAMGSIPMVAAVLMHGMSTARTVQERRVQELSILDRVSQTMRSTLDLKDLLPVIQQQVAQILGVNNFYVALYDRDKEELWYPLAVKNGQRQNWERRSMADRLTDRVIRENQPILLTPQTQAGPNPVGLPPSEDTPTSWLGVPLVVSEQAIGCLAVSVLTTGVEFTSDDIDLLTILSGQVSVAIDNALLYEQAQRRATQLETLNKLTGTITASLNPQEVLAHVCGSVSLVGGGQRSAVFLLDPGEDKAWLAYTHGLTEGFASRNEKFSIARSKRTRCLRSGQPVIVPDIQESSLTVDLIQLFRADGIQAFADFPLVAPDGQIGFLSVFFSEPHVFPREEINLLQTFASQAALAVSNARLHAVTDEQLSRRVHQLAILEAVGRELSAAIHSDELFRLILDYALEFTHSIYGAVALYHPEKNVLEIKANRGYETPQKTFPADWGITGQAVLTKQPVNVDDVTKDPNFVDLWQSGSRSQLSVPVIHEDRVLGVITLESSEVNAFEENEQSLVMQLANQAAISLINADLYGEIQRRLREQSTLYQVSTRLVGVLDVDEVVSVLESAMNALFVSDCVGIYLWHGGSGSYVLRNTLENQLDATKRLPLSVSNDEVQTLGIGGASGIEHVRISRDEPGASLFLDDRDQSQAVVFPLVSANQLLGFVLIQVAGDRSIRNDELGLIGAIIAQGSIAIQNARLFSDATHGRDRLSAIINSVGEGIILVNTQSQIILVNDPICTFTGVPLDELIQTPLSDLPDSVLKVIGYTQDELILLQNDLSQGQMPATQKAEYQVPDSAPARFLARETSPVLGQDGKAIGWMIVLRDETEEYEISQAREVITETLVHDLRSPMSAVLGAMDVIDDVLSDEERDTIIRQSLRVARGGARRVLGLIDALLDIACLQSGQMELGFMPMKLTSVVDELIPGFTLMANEYGLILRNDVPADLPVVMADQEKITRVITNLLDNAVKFTPEGGQVRISASLMPDEMIVVRVEDSGPGVPEEYREKIFERFSQIPGRRSRRRGSGLGLAFCRLAVEAHEGKIWVESPPGEGSVFTFTLPIGGMMD